MPRSDSGDSSGASLTSDEEEFDAPGPAPASPTYASATPAQRARPAPRVDTGAKRTNGPASSRPPLGPHARKFRAAAQKLIQMHRTSTLISKMGVGAEPGVDPRRNSAHALYGHLTQLCSIDVSDYSAVRSNFKRYDNAGFRDWLAREDHKPEPWVKVRWIHVNGISWDVLSMLALEYEIHPLALEDVLHSRSTSRSKASYYAQHLFLRVLCHTLKESSDFDDEILHDIPRSESPAEMSEKQAKHDPEATLGKNSRTSTFSKGGSGSSIPKPPQPERWHNRDADVQRRAHLAKLQVIKDQDDRVHVELHNFFMFLFRDGTVITIYAKPPSPGAEDVIAPIKNRLKVRDTLLRSTADPSLLVESLLDLIVDEALDVVDKYQDALTKLESAILIKPKMRLVRSLHIMSGDLALRKRSLEPIKSLVFGLRRYDRDRCVAVAASEGATELEISEIKGFMSHKAKIYLADVHDHVDYILSSMDLFTTQAENLISYTFNLSGYMTNETMRRLTLITMICLPLTLLTGYFGMNFNFMFSVNKHTDLFFWEIAIPMMAVLIPTFMWSDILRGVHKVQKTFASRKVARDIKAGRQPVIPTHRHHGR